MLKLRKALSKLKSNAVLFLLFPLVIIAPDFLAQVFNNANEAALSGKFIIGIFFFGVFLSFAPRRFIFLILGFFIILELIQFCHLFYFNNLISSHKLSLLFDEFDEVLDVAGEAMSFLYLVPFIVLIPYGILFYTLNKLDKKRLKTKLAIIPILLFLAIIPYRVNQAYNGVNYYPDPADHSLRNSLYAFTNFILNKVYPSPKSTNEYKDYKISQSQNWQDKNINIVLIIGESINPRHMSLFDYKRDTNPLLSTLKKDPNFIYSKAISGGINTIVSVPLLLNGIYEPNNYKALEQVPANLFKLAKKHNFKNFYISSQSGALLTNVGAEFIDYVMFRQKDPLLFNKYQDEAFLKIIPQLEYAGKNFIVIHQRSIHAPYEGNYAYNPKFNHFPVTKDNYQKFLIDTYDNAIRYNDYLLYEIINFYRNKFDGPTYIFFTPDHGEGIGHNNVYGHSSLNSEIYNVPFLAYTKNADAKMKEKIKAIAQPVCHFEIHNIISNILGFDINNPNKKPGICYIQGSNLYGLNEFVEYTR